ncbi:T-complex protein 11-like protein 1 [Merluccius polli]|uniref:T-complex protein 11-like protein 1 n=1 Tax=Merluccius polli TaxID=89951 RepID=A0AA47MMS7_MERPO|nr:T-complex protein 11-like protein 1 [Merluccius polli]
MPLNDERPTSSSSSGEEQGSDGEGSSGRCDSLTSASDMDCSRESFTSDSSSKHSTPSSSPPKNITLDDMMSSAKDLSNLTLAHEIIVNQDFHVEPPKLAQNSLEKLVRDTVHRAYWDILASELKDDLPKYEHAIKLLEEIKEEYDVLMNDSRNVQNVQEAMENDFALLVEEFRSLNREVTDLLSEDEQVFEQENWFDLKMAPISQFMKVTKGWIAAAYESTSPSLLENVQRKEHDVMDSLQETVRPRNSISEAGNGNAERASIYGSQASRATAASRVSATRAKQEAEHAALLECAATLKRKQELEMEAARIKTEKNVITELLVKQQQLSQLPTKDIPVFKGDALQYKSFIRAFEHAIDQKTDSDQDKLYFLEQFTAGEPKS